MKMTTRYGEGGKLTKLELDQIKPIAAEVAEEFPGRMNEDCYYSTPCLVGEILARLGVSVPAEFDGRRFSKIPWVRIGDIYFAPEAIAYLQKIQDATDEGAVWGAVA